MENTNEVETGPVAFANLPLRFILDQAIIDTREKKLEPFVDAVLDRVLDFETRDTALLFTLSILKFTSKDIDEEQRRIDEFFASPFRARLETILGGTPDDLLMLVFSYLEDPDPDEFLDNPSWMGDILDATYVFDDLFLDDTFKERFHARFDEFKNTIQCRK